MKPPLYNEKVRTNTAEEVRKMVNREIANLAALITSGALQSGKMPVEAEQAAEYYKKLYRLIEEFYAEQNKPQKSGTPQSRPGRITEKPDEAF